MKTLKHLFTALLLLCSTVAFAQSFEVDGINYNVTSSTDKTVEVSGGSNVLFPESVTYNGVTYSVTSIGGWVFNGRSDLTGELVIPNSVTSIGDNAFQDCSGLTSVVIGNSVTSIGSHTFVNCSGLTSVEFNAENCTAMHSYYFAFQGCTALSTVIIGENVKNIPDYAFCDCSALTNVVIPNSVTSIGNNAFQDTPWYDNQPDGVVYAGNVLYKYKGTMPANTSIVIKEGTTAICSSAFQGCSGLTSVAIPSSVTSIGDYAFLYCKGLTSITIPNSVTSIGHSAFSDCTGLTSITIPNSVTSIGDYAFSGCSGLIGELVIPNSVTSIGNNAFQDCCGLTSLTIGSGVIRIGANAFRGCGGLTGELVIPDAVTSIGSEAFRDCNGLTSLTIGNSVTSIETEVFIGCSGLTSIVIGNGVTSIGHSAFNSCSKLTSIEIPNSVTSIGSYAFYYCTGLKSVTIGNGVTSIGERAFSDCYGLEDVHISDIAAWYGIDFANVNANPLCGANNLYLNGELVTEVVIPEGVKEIKNFAFYRCTSLTSVEIPNSVTSIGEWAFFECSGLTSITIPNSVASIGDGAFAGINAIFDITDETPATVASNAFHAAAVIVVPDASVDAYKAAWSNYANQIVTKELAVRSVEIEASEVGSALRSAIGDEFTTLVADLTVKGTINSYDVIVLRTKMPLLRELDLSEATVMASDMPFYNGNCTKDNDLGGYAFCGLSKLNCVKLPKDLVSVGDYMFDGCSSLREVEIPENVKSIGYRAFNGCTSLINIELPKEMTNISNAAFKECYSLREIVIPSGIKSLPDGWYDGAFYDCSNLKKVTLPDGLEYIGMYTFHGCGRLKDIKLPPTVKTISEGAFGGCSSLEEIRIPSSVQSIASSAFGGCNNVNKVYTYTLEPLAMTDGLFPSAPTATLCAPSQSRENYYFAAGWNSFLKFEFFDEPYEYFYVNNDYVLNDDTGYIEGADGENPDADINAGGGFIVEGEQGDEEEPNQSLGDVNVGSNGEGTSGSIIGDNNLHIDNLNIKINVTGGRWYFFAFPFDIKFDKIYMENGSDYVFRYYDGEERAKKGNGGWKDVNENHLKAGRGYIFQCSANDVLVLNIKDVKFKKEEKYNELIAHVSENLKDASWNFTGNPYLSYYDMADMDYTAPVTVWDGEKYVAIRPGDDDYHFAPYEAFFVQKPENQENITFDGEEQMTKNQSDNKKERQAAARRVRSVDSARQLVNLVLGNGTAEDRTRIVFNESQSLTYEIACDATKFETAGVPQLYTIGNDKVRYAINERPADNGRVAMGYTAPTAGFYTIEAQRMDVEVYVKDFKTGTLHNLKDGAYNFSTDSGTFNDRFEILLKGTAPGTTDIDEVEGENGNVEGDIYDLQGRKMQNAGKGIYIIGGEKVMK